ncbi:C-C motif chemokine 22-like [Danio rerio]|uniref:C-C motif chemokine 22-like n=3 Tax=Danio rerio TaxID=7955 RepID=A0A0R4IFJ9_DANRE|nr:C-C motif chemokine 22-like [Danio rerio]|eukprot:XP_021326439.1 C-C motif chemokine 22-like [Danio rerio]
MKIIMKTALLFAVLCCALLPQPSDGQESADAANSMCCFGKGSNIKIPLRRLEYFYWTSSRCPLKHVVFVTIAKKHLCMNPDNEWVQKVINMKSGSGSSV